MINIPGVTEIAGAVAFAIAGALSAVQKRLDIFGVLIMGLVTATGRGTLRDVLIGYYPPVSRMLDLLLPVVRLATVKATILFKKYIKSFKVTLCLFDALGPGLRTVRIIAVKYQLSLPKFYA
jgi:uncharacterized membrane protein YeiH